MLGATAGTLPAILSKKALVALVRLYDSATFNEFVVQQLFGEPKLFAEAQFVIFLQETIRKLGTDWRSGPYTADPEVLHQVTSRLARAYYLSKSLRIESNHVNLVRMLDEVADGFLPGSVAALAQQKSREIAEGVAALATFIRRQLEHFCIRVLNNTTFSISIDGVTQNYPTFLSAENAKSANTGSWASPGTNILEEWGGWLDEFIELSGGPPTHILVEKNFGRKYILPNDDCRDFLLQNPEFINGDMRRMLGNIAGEPGPERSFTIVPVRSQYTDATGGSPTDLWPEGKMVWIRDPRETLMMATVATEDNDYNGGLWSYTYQTMNPVSTTAVVNFNGVPLILNPKNVMHFDLTP